MPTFPETLPPDHLDAALIRTVADVAAHMKRLRSEAAALQQALPTRARGYFTPSEDEQVIHLWVSYHKARAALLELIAGVRQAVEGGHGQSPTDAESLERFAIAYAAALILVDAARFLRDLFGSNQLVRRKLNESCAAYGIDADSFDRIQRSLTDPANALRLKEATEFYDQHRDSLHLRAADQRELRGVLTIADELRESVRVSTSRYLQARFAERRYQAREQIIKGGVRRAVYALQECGSRLVSGISTDRQHVSNLPAAIAAQLQEILRPGDVFVTRKECALTNYFLPGYWPHAAMYVGGGAVIEALKDGVRERPMTSPFGNDAVAVIRPRLEAALIEQAIARARTHLGKPYDFDFDFTRADRLVCTEVIYRSYEGLSDIRFSLTRRAGRQTLAAEDLLLLAIAGRSFEQVAVYCPLHSQQILVGEAMTSVLKQTMSATAMLIG